jgi:hypothetical protein
VSLEEELAWSEQNILGYCIRRYLLFQSPQ